MLLPGARSQNQRDLYYDNSGTITTGGTAQILLPERKSCSFLFIQNISDTEQYIKFGGAKATAVLTSGVVTSVTMNDKGFNYSLPPTVQFLGGGGKSGWNYNDGRFVGCTLPGWPTPDDIATGQAVLASASPLPGSFVNSITVGHGGSGYLTAPYVFIADNFNDPNGCATPSATSGVELNAGGGSWASNGTTCSTDPIAIYCATTGKAFTCLWLP